MKEYQKLNIRQGEFFANRILKRIIVTHGIIAAVSYVVFFFIMRAFGLLEVTELRFVNYAIFGIVSYFALSELRKHFSLNYFQDLGASFLVGIVSFFFLSLFIYFYLHIDISFANYLKVYAADGHSSPSELSIILFFEGSAMSAIVSFCVMQYFKKFMDKE
jgi:hypothetical protein